MSNGHGQNQGAGVAVAFAGPCGGVGLVLTGGVDDGVGDGADGVGDGADVVGVADTVGAGDDVVGVGAGEWCTAGAVW
jgi:hypothetical protein